MQRDEHPGNARLAQRTAKLHLPNLRFAVGFSVFLLAAHALAIHQVGEGGRYLSLAFLTFTPLCAGVACVFRGLRVKDMAAWIAAALAMFLWSAGMAANLTDSLFRPMTDSVSGASMLLFVLYGVPLIFALASPRNETWRVHAVDGALALASGYLFFVYTFSFASTPESSEPRFLNLRLMFDIENTFIAVFSITRFLASTAHDQRNFFRNLTCFAFAYLAAAAYINHVQSEADYGQPADLVIDLPFLLLLVLASHLPSQTNHSSAISTSVERSVRAASPLMLPATLLMVSGLLVQSLPKLAITGCTIAILGYGIRSVFVQIRSYDDHDKLAHLSHVDALTGLPNRRKFDEHLKREWTRATRSSDGLALLMVDIDHFKQINDMFGHQGGDRILREVSQALAQCASRATDLVCRYGGEEFSVVLPDTALSNALALAEAMRLAVERLSLKSPSIHGVVTVSIGASHTVPIIGTAPETLLAAADSALYDAKRSGRNKVASAGSV